MLDQYGRTIDYVRISVTDRCNLRCRYCMPEQGVEQMRCEDVLSYEEIARLCRLFASLGVKKIKLTGGEPLARLGICELVAQLKRIEGIEQVTITTNGVLLPSLADSLVRAGIDGVNISLDAANPKDFLALTRRDAFGQALNGLRALLELRCQNIKLNCVPIAEINGGQIADIAGFAKRRPIAVRFIELMPIGLAQGYTAIPRARIAQILAARYGRLRPCAERLGNGPAAYFSLPGFRGKIGFIEAVHQKFCGACNRVRLTADGFLKLCLQYNVGVDLRELLRGGASDAYIKKALEKNIYKKPREHRFGRALPPENSDARKMFQVGG